MPCRSDYMEPNAREQESKLVCQLLAYVLMAKKTPVPKKIRDGATEYYGDPNRLDEYTDQLCTLCKEMTEAEKDSIMYNGRNANARRLADWWERHQEVDRKRSEEEIRRGQRQILAAVTSARKPPSPAELRKLTEEAVERGKREHQAELQRIAEQEARQRRADELKAEGIIMQIPSKCEKEARNQRSHAVVMGLRYGKDHDQIGGNVLEVAKLKGAGKIVYDYCKDAGLNPTLEYWWSGDGMDSGYNIVVRW